MEIVWFKMDKILNFSKKMVSRFVTKKVSAFVEYFLLVKPLDHNKLIIGRLPSFMFFRSFDIMVSVAIGKTLL